MFINASLFSTKLNAELKQKMLFNIGKIAKKELFVKNFEK
jgi:hypothetical protein